MKTTPEELRVVLTIWAELRLTGLRIMDGRLTSSEAYLSFLRLERLFLSLELELVAPDEFITNIDESELPF